MLLLAEDHPSITAEELVRLDQIALRSCFIIRCRVAQPPFFVLIHVDASHYPRLSIGVRDNAVFEVDVLEQSIPISFSCPKCKKAKNTLYLRKSRLACQTCLGLTKIEGAIKRDLIDAKKIILSIKPWLECET